MLVSLCTVNPYIMLVVDNCVGLFHSGYSYDGNMLVVGWNTKVLHADVEK